MSNDWTWKLTDAADTQLDKLDPTAREQITGKLEEIVTNEWREPPQYVEPLQNAPHSKLRVGGYRVAVRLDRDQQITWVLNIHKREGAYTADD